MRQCFTYSRPRPFWRLCLGIVFLGAAIFTSTAALQSADKKAGGASYEKVIGYAVALDGHGNIFVAGAANTSWGSPVNAFAESAGNCFVSKLDDKGVMQWHTYLGAEKDDNCRALALDDSGNIYVAGESSSSWAEPRRSFHGGGYDGFVAKLNGDGILQWNTFLGGAYYDGAFALSVTGDGTVLVAGNSAGTWDSLHQAGARKSSNGFAAKLDPDGNLIWNTFLGGDGYDGVFGLALDEQSNTYVTGESAVEWGKPVSGFTPGYHGNFDTFTAKLDDKGRLVWNTFLGGIGSDHGRSIAVNGKAVVVGGNSDVSWGKPLNSHTGDNDHDIFVARLDQTGALQWNTFAGGKGPDYGRAVFLNWTGNIFLTGQSAAAWGRPIHAFTGAADVFALKLDVNGAMQWNTFLGDSGVDFGRSICMDSICNVFLTGESSLVSKISSHSREVFVAQLNNAGGRRWQVFLRSK